jgi:hypothetical protein
MKMPMTFGNSRQEEKVSHFGLGAIFQRPASNKDGNSEERAPASCRDTGKVSH